MLLALHPSFMQTSVTVVWKQCKAHNEYYAAVRASKAPGEMGGVGRGRAGVDVGGLRPAGEFHQAMISELVVPQLNLHFSITSINFICS